MPRECLILQQNFSLSAQGFPARAILQKSLASLPRAPQQVLFATSVICFNRDFASLSRASLRCYLFPAQSFLGVLFVSTEILPLCPELPRSVVSAQSLVRMLFVSTESCLSPQSFPQVLFVSTEVLPLCPELPTSVTCFNRGLAPLPRAS